MVPARYQYERELISEIYIMGRKSRNSEFATREYREAFDLIDVDGDGLVSAEEMGLYYSKLGRNYKKRDLEIMIATVDVNRDGKIGLAEFIKILSMQKSREEKDAALKQAFEAYDTDGSGKISMKELAAFFKNQGSALSKQQVKDLMEEVDLNHDGEIDFEEFKEMMRPH